MNDLRGSLWKKCDFHVHTPMSVLYHEFGDDFDKYVLTLFKKAIEKKVRVIGITDYFTIEGYKKLREDYLNKESKLKELFSPEEITAIKSILIIPNIEFRINKIIQIVRTNDDGTPKTESGRINFHIILSDELSIKEIEESFLHEIEFTYEADPDEKDKLRKLKLENLAELGKRLKSEQTELKGSDIAVGMTHAVVDDSKVVEILSNRSIFKDKYFVIVPSDEDLSKINWKSQDNLTRRVIIQRCHFLFSANASTIQFGLGQKAASEEQFIKEFKSLKACLWGSDSHKYDTLFEPAKQNYCWIKSDPTFEGIRQILFEPKDRVFLGRLPSLYERISLDRGRYLKRLEVTSSKSYDGKNGTWFKDFRIDFNPELVAIVGNKGKGKSALADIIALLGNARLDSNDFSFLNSNKFGQRGYGEYFESTLTWFDDSISSKRLSASIDITKPERVKYIPQSYLEKLCNDEEAGFKEEVNKVVFSRLEESDKLGMNSFDELMQYKAEIINHEIEELRVKLHGVNDRIEQLAKKASPEYKETIENKLSAKKEELVRHEESRKEIKTVLNPETDTTLSEEQKKLSSQLLKLGDVIAELDTKTKDNNALLSKLKIELAELQKVLDEVVSTKNRFDLWIKDRISKYQTIGIDIGQTISMNVDTSQLDLLIKAKSNDIEKVIALLGSTTDAPSANGLVNQLAKAKRQKEDWEKELEKPLKDYQIYLEQLRLWEKRKNELMGNVLSESSIASLEAELKYLLESLQLETQALVDSRAGVLKNIFEQKKLIQNIFSKVKTAITEILAGSSAEQNISIETSFRISKSFYSNFFDHVNRYGSFYSDGDNELRNFVQAYNLDDIEQVSLFINDLLKKDIRFKDNRKIDFLNFVFSLDYLNPEYDLRLNGKSLSKLSPGEKGGLLLVFYLVLDKNLNPLIIDQPEDNLDNQSVAEILVPYIKIAKRKRQIFMVTHNPNLAIVADAEQVIHMNIDKEDDYKVSFDSGAIEKPSINGTIVDILEGRMKAFNNRRLKYRKQKN